jgi:predicted ATPase
MPASSDAIARQRPAIAEAVVWQVRLLGGFEIDDGRHRLTRLRSRAAMALLARVALAPTRDHAREELATLLWPDADAAAGRARLRQTLSLLKAVLEPPGAPPVLLADRRVLRVAPGALWCDAVAFEQAWHAGQVARALALYRGDLLPGHYDEWVQDERQRLASLRERLNDTAPPSAAAAPMAVPADGAARRSGGTTRLPQYLTRLIGADLQGARLRALVADRRWTTVIGPGGCGKTRLACEVARWLCEPDPGTQAARFERAVFVPLVGAVDARQCLDRTLLALRLESGGDAMAQLASALDGQQLLLVLDNAEQLDDAAVQAFAGLAESLPDLHWLVTSRRPLGVDGEAPFPLATLDLPPEDAPLAELAMTPAVALFVDRARAHRADFHVQAGNASALADLVRWLEGLPLAIELAASHARSLGPAELLALLQAASRDATDPASGLAFLARRGARGGTDPRHASMRAVIDWSWRLLDAGQQHLLAMAAGLPAGLTRDAAVVLGSPDGMPLPVATAQAGLDSLLAHSVLKLQPGQDGRPRYLPYEPVREFTLAQRGAPALAADRRRVLHHWRDWARRLPATPPLPTVRDELPNLMAAMAAAPADGNAGDALQLVLLLQAAWGEIALPAGVLASLDLLLAAPDLDDSQAAAGHALAATAWQAVGQLDAVRRHMAAALARPCPDPAQRITVLSRLARMRWRVDKDVAGARALIAEAMPLTTVANKPNTEAAMLSLLAHMASLVDRDHAQARALSARSRALWAASGNRHLINAGRYNAVVQMIHAGQPEATLVELDALAEEGRALQDWDLVAGAYEARGTALLALRRWSESVASLRESLAVAWAGMEIQAALYALWNLPPALARMRRGELAALAMGAAEAQWRLRFGAIDARDQRDLRRVRRFARTLLGPQAAQAAWQQGSGLTLGAAVRQILQALATWPTP